MKTIPCPDCEANAGKAILDEHGATGNCKGGSIEVPETVEEWVDIQQPFMFPKEHAPSVVRAIKLFLQQNPL